MPVQSCVVDYNFRKSSALLTSLQNLALQE